MTRLILTALAFLLGVVAPAGAYDHGAAPLHCGDAAVDPQGWLRVTCPYEIEPMGVATIYVWFPRELTNDERVDWQINGAAWPLIVNPIRSNPREGKRTYLKFRVANPWPFEQAVTMHWLVGGR